MLNRRALLIAASTTPIVGRGHASTLTHPIGVHFMCEVNWKPVPRDRDPLIGRYVEKVASVCERQLTQMSSFGIDYVNLVWFWHADQQVPHANDWLQSYMASTLAPKPRFCLMWDNTFTTTTKSSWNLMTDYWAAACATRADMLRFNGRPVVTVYVPDLLKAQAGGGTDAGVRALLAQARAKANFFFVASTTGAHLRNGTGSAAAMGFDAVCTYNLVTGAHWGEFSAAWQRWRLAAVQTCELPVFIPMSSGWDNSSERGGMAISNPSMAQFEAGLREAKQIADQYPDRVLGLCMNAWNEYLEGSYIEPARNNGGTARGLAIKALFGK